MSRRRSRSRPRSRPPPLAFSFRSRDGRVAFACPLQCVPCPFTTRTGRTCARRVCIGLPYCRQHMPLALGVAVAPSPGRGNGLFAKNPTLPPDAAVFRRGDTIVAYEGEPVPRAELNRRYSPYTGPYAMELNAEWTIDGACRRGVANFANAPHAHERANAKFMYTADHTGVSLVATRRIYQGNEILANYGPFYRFDDPTVHRTRRPT